MTITMTGMMIFGGDPTWLAASAVSQLGTVSGIGRRGRQSPKKINTNEKLEHFFWKVFD